MRSETVKLIIEIPKEDYEWVQTHRNTDYQTTQMLYKRVRNGTPLDTVKAEIKALRYGSDTYKNAIDDAIEILDNIGKAESEVKPND